MEAKEKLQQHLDMLFSDAPRSRAVYELREELLANSLERYSDLVQGGMPEQQALDNVMGGIGNVEELIDALPDDDRLAAQVNNEERRARSAITTTVAVGLYILAGVVLFLGVLTSGMGFEYGVIIGLVLALVLCIVPTCMLVYNATRWPKYEKKNDTVVENFKEWNNDSKKSRSLRGAISSLVWTLTVVLYFPISFITGKWAYSWMIFLVAVCVEAAITLIFKMRELR